MTMKAIRCAPPAAGRTRIEPGATNPLVPAGGASNQPPCAVALTGRGGARNSLERRPVDASITLIHRLKSSRDADGVRDQAASLLARRLRGMRAADRPVPDAVSHG